MRFQNVISRLADPATVELEIAPRRSLGQLVCHVIAARERVSADAWAWAAVMVAVLVANLPYLLGVFDPNPLASISALTSSVTPGWLNGTPTLDPNVGFTSQAIGHLAALDLLHLRLPWWNPYQVTGMPLLGETQGAALFPPTLLTALSGGQLFEHILLELLAGICTYQLLRRIRVTRWAATAGAIAFALNGTFAWFADATVNPVPFLPMLLLGIERAFSATRTGQPGGWRLLAVAGALSVYAGFPELAYIGALMGMCWIGWRCGCLERHRVRIFLAKAALGGVVGTLLAGPMLVAMSSYLNHAWLGVHTSGQVGSVHLRHYAVPQLLMPYIYGQVNGNLHGRVSEIWSMVGGYLSTSLLLFAALGIFSSGRRGLRFVLLGWTLLVFARMYGQPPLLGHVIGVLPGMSRIEFFRYATSALELSVVVLAALGLDDLARVPEHRRRLLWGALAVLAAVVVGVLATRPVLRSFGARFQQGPYFTASIVWGALVPLAAAAGALVRTTRVRVGLLALLMAADALALFVIPEFSAPRAQTVDLAPVAYLRHHLGQARFFTLGPIQPNYGSYFGLGSLNVNDFPPKAYADYVHTELDDVVNPQFFVGNFGGWRPRDLPTPKQELMRHLDGYRAAGVRYVLTPAGDPLPATHRAFRLVFRSRTSWIYRLGGTSSYFSATGCRVAFDQRESAHLWCLKQATLIRRESWFPGWTASVDGRSMPIRRINGLFQGVTVQAGSHRVVFTYSPPDMDWALLGALAGCGLMGMPWLARRARRRS